MSSSSASPRLTPVLICVLESWRVRRIDRRVILDTGASVKSRPNCPLMVVVLVLTASPSSRVSSHDSTDKSSLSSVSFQSTIAPVLLTWPCSSSLSSLASQLLTAFIAWGLYFCIASSVVSSADSLSVIGVFPEFIALLADSNIVSSRAACDRAAPATSLPAAVCR